MKQNFADETNETNEADETNETNETNETKLCGWNEADERKFGFIEVRCICYQKC